jgi:hypothetical protein
MIAIMVIDLILYFPVITAQDIQEGRYIHGARFISLEPELECLQATVNITTDILGQFSLKKIYSYYPTD